MSTIEVKNIIKGVIFGSLTVFSIIIPLLTKI
jgi:hypothetical protein